MYIVNTIRVINVKKKKFFNKKILILKIHPSIESGPHP